MHSLAVRAYNKTLKRTKNSWLFHSVHNFSQQFFAA
jgi:hypothetical protein